MIEHFWLSTYKILDYRIINILHQNYMETSPFSPVFTKKSKRLKTPLWVLKSNSGNTLVLQVMYRINPNQWYFIRFTHNSNSPSPFSILFSLIYYSLFNSLKILKCIIGILISLIDKISNSSPKTCHLFHFLETLFEGSNSIFSGKNIL